MVKMVPSPYFLGLKRLKIFSRYIKFSPRPLVSGGSFHDNVMQYYKVERLPVRDA